MRQLHRHPPCQTATFLSYVGVHHQFAAEEWSSAGVSPAEGTLDPRDRRSAIPRLSHTLKASLCKHNHIGSASVIGLFDFWWNFMRKIITACTTLCVSLVLGDHLFQWRRKQFASGGHNAGAENFLMCPPLFSCAPTWGAQRLFVTDWDIIEVSPRLCSLHIYWWSRERGNKSNGA